MGSYLISVVGFVILLLSFSEISLLCLCGNSSMGCKEQEKQALLKFKSTLIDPSQRLSSWINSSNIDCCQWRGILCHNLTGHVLELNLRNPCSMSNEICDYDQYSLESSQLHPSLMQLQHLKKLDLSGNNFSGIPIPSFFSSMEQLRYLSLSNAGFGGKILENLGNLSNLQYLDLSSNDFLINDMNWVSRLQSLQHLDMTNNHLGNAHNLIEVIYKLPSLLHLHLSGCGIQDLIPSTLLINFTYVPKVQVLDLVDNGIIEGPILDAFQNMTSVRVLDLTSNNLISLPNWLSKFDSLKEVNIADNALLGPIPLALRNSSSSIRVLDLSGNNLSLVPSWLGEFKSLQSLNLAFNKFATSESPLPSILRNMCQLKSLDLSNNNLQGEVFGDHKLFGCIKHDLEKLDLSQNEFNGTLPTWLGQFENLRDIHIAKTFFHGPIPSSLGKLSQLTKLDLVGNHLNGSIPNSLALLVNLTYLRLSYNALEGVVPKGLGKLVKLTILDLSKNHLNGTIPPSLGQLVNLEDLSLSNNNLHGEIPKSFGQLLQLLELDLSSNILEGEISDIKKWSSFKNLTILNLSNNQISGSLPENIVDTMPGLESLILGNNIINGSIPNTLCKFEALSKLDLSKNKLSGEIPNCWRDNQAWDVINLSSNNLKGGFPSSFANLSSLLWLHLNNNSLQGELPSSLKNLKQLIILDLGENQFSGNIPSSWTRNTFPSLHILRLRQNMLSGMIPLEFCHLTSLQILDLANNNLTGSIPNCVGNLTGMMKMSNLSHAKVKFDFNFFVDNFVDEWSDKDVKEILKGTEFDYVKILKFVVNMDLSDNNLVGSIPTEITKLIGLLGLNLSNNHLKGEIPEMIGNMQWLESLDISNNQISGKIPNSMSSLTFLSHLNLSYNNFSGPIPRENQFLTLDDPYVYAGNPYLCGSPLPRKCPGDDDSHQIPESKDFEDENDSEKFLLYSVVAVGFASGFWGAIGILIFKRNWRHACFQLVEDVADELYIATVFKMKKLKRVLRIHANN